MKKKSSTKTYGKEHPVKKVKEPAAVYKTAKTETIMKHVTIGIPNKQYAMVLKLVKSLPDITIREEEDFVIPEWQKEIVRQRIKNAKPENFKSYSEVQKNLKKKYGL